MDGSRGVLRRIYTGRCGLYHDGSAPRRPRPRSCEGQHAQGLHRGRLHPGGLTHFCNQRPSSVVRRTCARRRQCPRRLDRHPPGTEKGRGPNSMDSLPHPCGNGHKAASRSLTFDL